MVTASFTLPVGVVTAPTDAKKSVSWMKTNFIRWSGEKMIPIAGWERFSYTAPDSFIRAIHTWRDLSNREWTAYLTESKLYVDYGGALVDISPTPAIEPYVPGAGGYGDAEYNYDDYGDARPAVLGKRVFGPCFTLDNWGENLLAMSSVDGRLLQWEPPSGNDPPDPAGVVPNAPTGCRTFVVTPERVVQVFCPGGDISSYAWCDQEDIENWTPGITSFAGDLPVEPASPVVAALAVDGGTLFTTAKKVYISEYIGLPYIFRTLDRADGAAPISAGALRRVIGGAVWVSESGFWRLNGVSIEPITCEVWPWLIENIDWNVARMSAVSVVIETLSEFWFFFPTKGSTRNDRAVVLNFRDGWWAMHDIGRSAGYSSNYVTYPIMADGKRVYKHESGNTFADTPLMPYAESFSINAFDGASMTNVRQLQPEVEGDTDALRFSFLTRMNRAKPDYKTTPQRRVQPNGLVDVDASARDFRMRIDQIRAVNEPWTLGVVNIDAVALGKMP